MIIIILIVLIGLIYYRQNLKIEKYYNIKKYNMSGLPILQDIIYNERNKLDINNRSFYK